MKVLFISRRFYPETTGGGQISAFAIAKAVKQQGHEVFVLTFVDGGSFEEEMEGVKIFREHIKKLKHFPRLSNMDYMYFEMSKTAEAFVEKLKPDVVHLLNFESIPITARKLKRKFGIPLFATANGPIFGCFTQAGLDYKGRVCLNCPVGRRLIDCIYKWGLLKGILFYIYSLYHMPRLRRSYKHINKFFAVSSAMKTMLMAMDVPEERISVVHNPMDVHNKIKTSLKKELGIEGKRVLLYAGRLEEDKGIHRIVQALPHLEDTVLIIVGKGHYTSNLKELTKNLSVQDKVIFIDHLSHDQLPKYYSIAEIVILPCTIYETLSRMLLEAASFGIPLIASNAGGNSDIVEDGKNGILLKSLDTQELVAAIKRILSNPRLADDMGKKGREKISKMFSPERIGKQIVDAYGEELQ